MTTLSHIEMPTPLPQGALAQSRTEEKERSMSLNRVIRNLFVPASLLTALFVLGCSDAATDDGSDPDNGGYTGGGKAEAWDDANAPAVFGLSSLKLKQIQEETALRGYLAEKPWADTYWPLNKKGVSDRWNGSNNFETFEAQRDDAIAALGGETYESTWKLSPAEKYDILVGDTSYALTKDGWDVFDSYKDYEYSWSWMGHCHGWAPAAYLEQTPKASVMATIDGKQMLFTEGDIRGLLTKAHATNNTTGGTRFLGTRCNARTIIKDENGRIVDGTVYAAKEDAPKAADTATASTIFIDRNFWGSHHVLTYTDAIDSKDIKVMQATASADEPKGAFVVNIYASIADYQSQTVEKESIFLYNKECRDTNAGTFHLVLVQYLSDQNAAEDKRGFVMDVTREDQVWNQPAYGFESTITAVENVAEIEDPLAAFRAEGTVQIARVESKVSYGLERGPYVDYTEENGSNITSKTYKYSLEIDADGYVIGGEWDVSSGYGGSSAPDFLWAPQGSLTNSDKINYSEISKIHQCSLEIDRAKNVTLPDGKEIQVVDCEL